jgi:pyruvate/2-oxoglutarate dehydrogenase complex dihydrolipoamide dehydrogenase (E3) component
LIRPRYLVFHARFASPQAVEVAGERLRAGRIYINVGGRALVPQMPGINGVPYLANSSMMDVDFLPLHLFIVGGSYIGLDGCRRVQAATSAVIFI